MNDETLDAESFYDQAAHEDVIRQIARDLVRKDLADALTDQYSNLELAMDQDILSEWGRGYVQALEDVAHRMALRKRTWTRTETEFEA